MNISDTSPEARKVQMEIYRRTTPAQKLELVFDAYRTGQIILMAGIRAQYPDADEEQVWHIRGRRDLGEKLYNEVYGNRKK